MRRTVTVALSFALGAACWLYAAQSAEQKAEPAHAKETRAAIADFAWIAGAWRTNVGPDVLEEKWNPPLGNQMLGMFQWQKDGKVWLNELVSITQGEDGKIAFRLRHFGPDMTAWEEKDKPSTTRWSA